MKDKVRPSDAIRSLEQYHIKVLTLIQVSGMALQHNLVDAKISADLQNALDEVKEFYHDK